MYYYAPATTNGDLSFSGSTFETRCLEEERCRKGKDWEKLVRTNVDLHVYVAKQGALQNMRHGMGKS